MKETCATCRFYEPAQYSPAPMGDGVSIAKQPECRRYPTYVYRESREWCGEHKSEERDDDGPEA